MELTELKAEARDCKDCLGWLKHCNAECCRETMLLDHNYDLTKPAIIIKLDPKKFPRDRIWYYKLHGIQIKHDFMVIPTKFCTKEGPWIKFKRKCDALTDENLCKLHGHAKPKVCREFTLESYRDHTTTAQCTPNCLFKYKLMEEKEHGKTQPAENQPVE